MPSGDSGKIIRGSEFETEFDNIATAIATKADAADPTFTGTVTIDGLTVNGNTVLGNAATDTVTVTADIASNLIPSADDTYNLGAVGAEWNDLFIDGTANIDSLVADTADINGGTIDGVTIGGSSAGAITGTTITGTSFVTSGDMTFGDNDKAIFGASSDLQIYHDSSNGTSVITESGGGDLLVRGSNLRLQSPTGDNYFVAINGGASNVYHGGSVKLATTSTGVDVTGSISADGLTVDGTVDVNLGSDGSNIASLSGASAGRKLDIQSFAVGASAGAGYSINATSGQGELDFQTAGASRLNIDAGGDISFYNSAGTSQSLFWDASAESLGVGTTSPNSTLEVSGTNAGAEVEGLRLTNSSITTNTSSSIVFNLSTVSADSAKITAIRTNSPTSSDTELAFSQSRNGTLTERMRIDSSGNVGIGTDSPGSILDISAGTNLNAAFTQLSMDNFTNDGIGITFSRTSSDADLSALDIVDTDKLGLFSRQGLIFGTGGSNAYGQVTEAMRVDSSGDLLVGKTSTSLGTAGIVGYGVGLLRSTRAGDIALELNRTSSDGSIADFKKDGTTVGSIGSSSGGGVFIGSGDTGLNFRADLDAIYPWGPTGGARADVIDLGYSTVPFKDLYLSGGVYLGGNVAANKLDDYEEGTFTPEIEGTTTAGTGSYASRIGKYVKVGNLVTVWLWVNQNSHTGTGNMLISGLPFTSDSQGGQYSASPVMYGSNTTKPADTLVFGWILNGVTYIRMRSASTGATATSSADLAIDTDSQQLHLTMSYHAA